MIQRAQRRQEFNRLRWRCRRGMREIDDLLIGYLESGYSDAPAAERLTFERFISLPDPQILALLTGQVAGQDPAVSDLVQRILAAHRNPSR